MNDQQMSLEALLSGGADASASQPFSLEGPLPRGSTLIEASAGTGKTYTLTHLAANFIERDALPIGQLLLVTYTRAAAGELRDRLRRVLQERAATAGDPKARLRLRTAAEDFDTATITTIHGFCQQVLTTLGVNVPLDPAMRLLADETSLVTQVAADVLATEALAEVDPALDAPHDPDEESEGTDAQPQAGALPSLGALTEAIAAGSTHPGIVLRGHPDEPDANRLARLTATGLTELDRRLGQRSLLTYQQLLNRVEAAVSGPKNSGVLSTLRKRFRVALIDEFQDTDPVQWEVFRRLFADGDTPGPALVLVGDPKQAIYSFRGADIATYLDASGVVQQRSHLADNFRSTPQLLDGLNTLFADARFGSSPDGARTIDYTDVSAGNPSPGTLGGPALRFRCFDMPAHQDVYPTDIVKKTGKHKPPPVGLIRHLVGLDLVHQVRSALDEGAIAQDITVLVTSNKDAQRIQRMLSEAGLPAVLGRAGSVVDSPAAEQVRRLLWAMERPASAVRVRSAALGWFVGLTAQQVDALDDEALAELQGELRDNAQILRRRGIAELAHHLRTHARPHIVGSSAASTLGTRLLNLPSGERHLTDLNHIWELLSERTGARGTTPSNALESLAASADPEEESVEVLQRRTEADGGAITVMTVHVSKGLQNKIVMVPYLWTKPPNVSAPLVTHDPDTGKPMLAVAYEKGGAIHEAAKRAFTEEGDRLAYVALTRAQERLIVWVAPGSLGTNSSRLMTRLSQRVGKEQLGDLDEFEAAIEQIAEEAPDGCIGMETFLFPPDPPGTPSDGSDLHDRDLDRSRWDRSFGLARRRWSFSALTADKHGLSSGTQTAQRSEDATGAGDVGADDEGLDDLDDPDQAVTLRPATKTADAQGTASSQSGSTSKDLWADLGPGSAGAAFGTLVHEALEDADLEAADLEAELAEAIAGRGPPPGLHQDRLATAVAAACTTPMGGVLGSLTLAGLPRADQLREMDFDLPLDGAVRPTAADIGRCVDAWLPPEDPMFGHSFDLGSKAALPLAGMLTGSIDLVIRAKGLDGEADRYVVADYKTNLLAERGTTDPEAAHPDRLASTMAKSHYQLQALLYEVGLHRFLRWRLPNYDPEVHLGGAAYLFIRGMAGPDTPTLDDGRRYGAFTWQPPAGLIVALSDLLAGAALDEVTP